MQKTRFFFVFEAEKTARVCLSMEESYSQGLSCLRMEEISQPQTIPNPSAEPTPPFLNVGKTRDPPIHCLRCGRLRKKYFSLVTNAILG
jgi:hypothetical protein